MLFIVRTSPMSFLLDSQLDVTVSMDLLVIYSTTAMSNLLWTLVEPSILFALYPAFAMATV